MTNVVPRRDNPWFQDLIDFRRDFDQIFSRLVSGGRFWTDEGGNSADRTAPAIESYVDMKGKTFHLAIAFPGVDPNDLQIHAQGNTAAIGDERKLAHDAKDVDWLHRELWYGTFERTPTLPEGVDTNTLSAESHNGLLKITAPVAASALPRRIEIRTTSMAKQMSA